MALTKTRKKVVKRFFPTITIGVVFLMGVVSSAFSKNNTLVGFLFTDRERKLKFVAEDIATQGTIFALLLLCLWLYKNSKFGRGRIKLLNYYILLWAVILAGLDILHLAVNSYGSFGAIKGSDLKIILATLITILCFKKYRINS